MKKKIGILFFTFILLLASNIYFSNYYHITLQWPLYAIHLFFFIFGWTSVKVLSSKELTGNKFVTYFMGLTAAKLFLSLLLLTVIILIDRPNKIFWAISFAFAYLVSLGEEVLFNLKKETP